KLFQIKVPMDAIKIIGIETGVQLIVRGIPLVPAPSSSSASIVEQLSVYGCLTLQSCEKPNVFYSSIIKDELINEDYSIPHSGLETGLRNMYEKKIQEDILIDSGTTVINGFYQDYLGESLLSDAHY